MPDLTIEERVAECRFVLEAGQGLPDWEPTRWVNAIVYRLGRAALHAELYEDSAEPPREDPLERERVRAGLADDLVAIAAVAMDAFEALKQRAGDA